MYSEGPWLMDEQKRSAPDLQYNVAPNPKPQDSAVEIWAFASQGAYVLFKDGSHHAEAWELLKFIDSKEGQGIEFLTFPGVCRGDITDLPFVQADLEETPQKEILLTSGPHARIEPVHPGWAEIWSILQPELEAVLLQKKGAQEALDTAAARAEEILAEYQA
jgi:ABC-type glycerol-3-phosphate transport system substrate-binding protein